jgi:hypothetical protein
VLDGNIALNPMLLLRAKAAGRVESCLGKGGRGPFLDSTWTPDVGLTTLVSKPVSYLVGLPGFEPGTSCTPN